MRVDLHSHSNHSDGKWSVPELLEEAEKKGVELYAITDHDNIAGSREAFEHSSLFSGKLVAGIEISTKVLGRRVHLLAFFPDIEGERIAEVERVLSKIQNSRLDRMKVMIQKANSLGFDITMEDVLAEAGKDGASTDVISRPHIGRVMVKKKYVHSLDEAFEKYIREGRPMHAPRFSLDFESWIRLIHQSGGIVIWAHPLFEQDNSLVKLQAMGDVLLEKGIDGVEVIYSYTRRTKLPEQFVVEGKRYLEKFVRENDLLQTAGGDFHGDSGLLGELELSGKDVDRFLHRLFDDAR